MYYRWTSWQWYLTAISVPFFAWVFGFAGTGEKLFIWALIGIGFAVVVDIGECLAAIYRELISLRARSQPVQVPNLDID